MANRNTMHLKHFEAFTAYLTAQGYEKKPTTNDYEVLRMRKGKNTIILYRRNNMEQHYSVRDKDMWLVYNFLGTMKRSDDFENHYHL